jgi:glycosyltransferase involved in cell wall biosynthesis
LRVCFIHQNLPTQYRYLIVSMLQRGDEVIVIGEQAVIDRVKLRHPKFNLLGYSVPPENQRPAVPQHLREFDLQVGRGQAVAKALRMLREKRLEPDLIFVHPGWGEAMFIRNECPQTPLVGYCESFHRARSAEHGFDPEFAFGPAVLHQMQIRKLPHLLALDEMDAGICPSEWQRAQFPAEYGPRLSVVHEGVDCDALAPKPDAAVTVGNWPLKKGEPIVTYVARNLEPHGGFHVFMRALPRLQQLAPDARVVIVGGDEVSFGMRLPPGESHRARLVKELEGRLDLSRILFAGDLPHATTAALLQVSAVHAYLTYPFVMSWSLLEAMASGCAIVASRTAPVQEVIEDGVNGWLTDFFDTEALADKLASVLAGRPDTAAVREAARRTILERYDLQRYCVPLALALFDRMAAPRR